MLNEDKVKKALQLCSEKKCDECQYNRWVHFVCQTYLCKDALAIIEHNDRRNK